MSADTDKTSGRQDEKRKLPAGWRRVRLGEVCEVVGGSTPDTGNTAYWDGEIVWVTPTDLGKLSDIKILTTARRITYNGLQSCGTEMLPVGTVIMSSRAPIGHLAIAGVPLCTNQGCKSFVPSHEVDSIFLYWTLKRTVPDIQALGSGATFTEVSKSSLQRFEIPLPPLPEQRRIAGLLKEQMAAVEKARQASQEKLQAAKALPAAFLRQAFPRPGQPLPNGWRWVRLDDVCEVRLGKMLSPASKVGNRSVPYIRNANVQWNRFDLADVAEMDFSEDQESILKLKIGDLLVCEGGEPGRAAVWQGQISRCCYQKALHRLRPINDAIDPSFVMYRLWHGASNSEFIDSNAKTTIAHLPAIRLKSLKIAIPILSEQRRIVAIIEDQIATAEKARAAAAAELAAINALPATLLRRAFAGEL